jgi:hypothetical protein
MPNPNFFIVGAPKCGTTALYSYLKDHPDVFMPERKEPRYFGFDYHRRQINNFHHIESEAEYLALFDGAAPQQRIGEASPHYLYSRTAAQEIHAFNPAAKIIIMLRSPVDALYSLYSELRFQGHEPLPTLEAALAAEPERRAHGTTAGGYIEESVYYRDRVMFCEQVRRYVDVFGREQVHVIIFDDFKRDTAQVFRAVLEFLEIDPDYQPDLTPVNPNKEARFPFLRDFLRRPPRSVLVIGRAVLPLAQPVYRALVHLNTRYAPRAAMDPALRRQLQAEFLPDVQCLSDLLGRDLTHWCKD